tara:strand:+ start:1018 stop:1488 length:471 start_codon:yes stop_codon:yes gene_type:complete
MSKVKSYILDEIDENEFSLIAIHSSCEAYFMAFLLNLKCNCKFIRSIKRKGVAQKDFPFEDYEWIDLVNGIEISLFSNRILIFKNEIQKGISLFDVPETKELYLVQDLKEVDYIVKIDSGIEANMMIKKIESIDQISYLYLIDQSRLSIDPNLNTY